LVGQKQKGAKSWKIAYAPTQDFANAINETVAGNVVKLPIRLDGTYYIKVQALDENGKVIANSNIRPIKVREKPLPKTPEYKSDTPGRFISKCCWPITTEL
jgi:hypothetical protein